MSHADAIWRFNSVKPEGDAEIVPERVPASVRAPMPRHLRRSESQRLLGTLHAIIAESRLPRAMVFASAQAGEGKTELIASMARHLAQSERSRVLLVDLTGSRRGVARRLRVPAISLTEAVNALSASPHVIADAAAASGIVVAQSESVPLFKATTLLAAIDKARLTQCFDYVLIEFPAFADWPGVVASSMVLGEMVIVVGMGRTKWPAIDRMREEYEVAGGKVRGVVLTKRSGWLRRRFQARC